jgi:hypothetical protein
MRPTPNMRATNRSAIVVVPKEPFLNWLHSIDPTSSAITLDDLSEEPTVYLLPECEDDEAVDKCLREAFAEIFEEELRGWWTERSGARAKAARQ